ncbi:MAG: STAS domain-containing protein [Bdellovibrionales bacterium]
MEAWIERSGDVVVVHLKGRVDYESTEPFRAHCARHLSQEKVVFNLQELSFVGSIGITDFVSTVTDLANGSQAGIKFAAMGNEFRRIFEASQMMRLEIYESTDRALLAFQGAEVSPLPRLSADEETNSEAPAGN